MDSSYPLNAKGIKDKNMISELHSLKGLAYDSCDNTSYPQMTTVRFINCQISDNIASSLQTDVSICELYANRVNANDHNIKLFSCELIFEKRQMLSNKDVTHQKNTKSNNSSTIVSFTSKYNTNSKHYDKYLIKSYLYRMSIKYGNIGKK